MSGQAPEPEETEIGGVLGRAMARARRTGRAPDEERARDEFPATLEDLLRSPLGPFGLVLFAACAAAVLLLLSHDWYGMVLSCGGLVIAFWGAAQVALRRLRTRLGIVVGVDGVLVRGWFVPYSRIRSVDCLCDPTKKMAWSRRWTASLELDGGERVEMGYRYPIAYEITRAVREARAAWMAGRHSAGAEDELFTRRGRSSAEWVHALRLSASSRGGVYRAVDMDIEKASGVLNDPRAAPSARAAAAIMLATGGDRTAQGRLRLAAVAMASPRLRIALEKVASAEDDPALAEALDEVLWEDGGQQEEHRTR